jgi:signal transduction histidine kinase
LKKTKRNAGIYRETPYLLSKIGDRSYLLYGHILFLHPRLPQGFYFILVLVLLLFIASYLFIRTIIKPVKQLQKAVEQIKAGNLDIHIPVRRMDELGELSVRFNLMADQIRKMLKAKDQLLLDVSHELRSPLTRMKVAAEFINDPQLKHTLTEEMDGMEGMIAEILETARINSPHGRTNPEEIRLPGLLETITGSFARRKPGIVLEAKKNTPVIRADARQLTILFNNILDNALRYSAHQEKPVRVEIRPSAEGVYVSVKDSGYGIPHKDLPYIFEPFYRVDSSRSRETGGYGIGFSLSKRIVDAHGGTIGIQSTAGRGTKVIIFLPYATAAP